MTEPTRRQQARTVRGEPVSATPIDAGGAGVGEGNSPLSEPETQESRDLSVKADSEAVVPFLLQARALVIFVAGAILRVSLVLVPGVMHFQWGKANGEGQMLNQLQVNTQRQSR